MELEQIKQQLAAIQKMCSDVMLQIEKLPSEAAKPPEVVIQQNVPQQQLSPNLLEIKSLLDSAEWPAAVAPQLICDDDNEQDKFNRAKGIISVYLDELVENKKFLDFGTGQGHLPLAAKLNQAKVAVGYDLHDNFTVANDTDLTLTTNWQTVMHHGPYDIITVFDVADHLINETMVNVLLNLKTVLAEGGKIYVRYHPSISRHGGHLYKKINKAFAHLILSDEQIKGLLPQYVPEKINPVVDPIRSYSPLPAMAGLKIHKEKIQETEVEPFFEQKIIADKILANTGLTTLPKMQMKIDFVDHVYVV
jgi:2-polyprenyl-3-methyl-5-hydroxy-6-metoxy-1,4-benzoquinol methylase